MQPAVAARWASLLRAVEQKVRVLCLMTGSVVLTQSVAEIGELHSIFSSFSYC
jgi:hypothetical protein